MCDPKTRLRGSLRATKCLDASYSVLRHHTITVGPYRGVPRPPWVQQNPTCKIFTVFKPNLPCKAAKTTMGPSCASPKPVCRRPCGQPSAWMPPTVSQHTTQSPWDPILRSTGHPGSDKIQLVKFSPFSSQICLAKLPKPPRDHLALPQSPSAGVLAGHQVLGCLLQCPKMPHNQYGALPWGPPGTLGPAKSKNQRISPILGSPKKTQVKNPQSRQKAKKIEIPQK